MRYGKDYSLRKDDGVVLYGAATTGAILYDNLTRRGFRVDAFMDRRADEIEEYRGLPVWDAAAGGRYAGPRGSVAVVAVKNVFEHERIAGTLWRAGFRKIVFRPYRAVRGEASEPERRLNECYDRLLDKSARGELPPCPEIEGPERRELRDHGIILDQGGYVTANIPVPYVFADKYQDADTIWGDIPCLGLLPHRGLFELFGGKWTPDCEAYMEYCRQAAEKSGGIVTSAAWEASVYQNRLDVFNHMQYAWEHDRAFFVRNAVEGVYNEKGYFNIRSGKHRITYMISKGSRCIPLRIKKAGYEAWRGRVQAERLADFLWENRLETLPAALEDPYFYEYPSSSSAFYERTLFSLLTMLYREGFRTGRGFHFEGRRVLFRRTPMALYADVFRALGFEIFLCERDPLRRELYRLAAPRVRFQELDSLEDGPERYDIAVLEQDGHEVPAHISVKVGAGQAPEGKEPVSWGVAEGERVYCLIEVDS